MVKKITREAVLADWKMVGPLFTGVVHGPFKVRVMPSKTGKSYIAKVMPTEQEFKGISFKNVEETCCTVQALFGQVIEPWRDVV